MPENSRAFMIECLREFCQDAIIKYCAGSREHSDNILDRPAFPELRAEIIDCIFYLGALKKQMLGSIISK